MNKKKLTKTILAASLSIGVLGSGLVYFTNQDNALAQVTDAKEDKKVHFTASNTDINKINIQNTMLNAIDHYSTVSGSLEYYSKRGGFNLSVTYQNDLSEKPKSYEKTLYNQNINAKTQAIPNDEYEVKTYDGDTLSVYKSGSKERSIASNTTTEKIAPMSAETRNQFKGTTMKERIGTMEGQKLYNFRYEPSLMSGTVKTSLLPEDIAMGFLEDTTKWNIKGEEKIAGVNTVAIEGILKANYIERFNAKNFKVNVDPNTGIMLQMEVKDDAGAVVEALYTKNIEIDSNLNQKLFSVVK